MHERVDIRAVILERTRIQMAMSAAALEALEDSRRRGLDVPAWRDGKVVWVPARVLIASAKAGGRSRRRKLARSTKRPKPAPKKSPRR